MQIVTHQIKGKGRGKKIGIPTINLKIPDDFNLQNGIYAARVRIQQKIYSAALHYGPVPTFEEENNSLEIMLIDTPEKEIPNTKNESIEVNIGSRIREIKKFISIKDLKKQIDSDITMIKDLLKINI